MIKTEKLEILCKKLDEYPFDWNEVYNRFIAHPGFREDNSFRISDYIKYFSEIHLDLMVEKAAEEHPELEIDLSPLEKGGKLIDDGFLEEIKRNNPKFSIDSNFLEGKGKQRDYVFWCSQAGRWFAYNREDLINKNRKYARQQEYDKLIMVGKVPVVLEIKLTRWEVNTSKHKRPDGSYRIVPHRGVKGSMRPEFYNRKLYPVRQFFGSDVGYMVVIPRDLYYRKANSIEGSIYSEFKRNNGILVPFYTDRDKFKEYLKEKVKEFGLNLLIMRNQV